MFEKWSTATPVYDTFLSSIRFYHSTTDTQNISENIRIEFSANSEFEVFQWLSQVVEIGPYLFHTTDTEHIGQFIRCLSEM